MCGIVGYAGNREALPILLEGLKKLEYRGYDSAGIALYNTNLNYNSNNINISNNINKTDNIALNHKGLINVVKCKGRLKCLEEKIATIPDILLRSNIGIGHTRWATHGEPNDMNSHPHVSNSGEIAVVHNGIIENYIKLKEMLQAQGFNFISETDTEVIAHLIEYYYKGNILNALLESLKQMEGSYAIAVLSSDYPHGFITARKGSPLIVGLGEDENFIASDIPAILNHTKDAYLLDDGEIAMIEKNTVEIFNSFGSKVNKNVFKIEWDVSAAEKGGYEHFMVKEICEEPEAVKNTISPRIKNIESSGGYGILPQEIFDGRSIKKINIVACGTAYHAGVIGKYAIEKLAGIPVEVDISSEFRYRNPIIKPGDITIIISQSGETIDTLFALREAKRKGSKILAIVNVVGSSIARESDHVLYTWAGPEIAVASTKAYNTQLAMMYLIAVELALKTGKISRGNALDIISELEKVPLYISKVLKDREILQRFASLHYSANSVFYIGRGLDYALAMEGSLKLKEISYIHSEAYAGGELKHGTIALIEDGTLVIAPITQDILKDKMLSNVKEVKARGAVVLAIARECDSEEVSKTADTVITIPDILPILSPLVAITPLQLLAYYFALHKGCDIDKPRNLAKSVTVE